MKYLLLILLLVGLLVFPDSTSAADCEISATPTSPTQGAEVATVFPELVVELRTGCEGTNILGAKLLVQSGGGYIAPARVTLVSDSVTQVITATVTPVDPLPIGFLVVGVQFTTQDGDVNTFPFYAPVNFSITIAVNIVVPVQDLYEGWNPVQWPEESDEAGITDALEAFVGDSPWEAVAYFDGVVWQQAFANPPLPSFNTLKTLKGGETYWFFTHTDIIH